MVGRKIIKKRSCDEMSIIGELALVVIVMANVLKIRSLEKEIDLLKAKEAGE